MQPLAFTTALADIRRDESIATAQVAHLPEASARRRGDVTIRAARPEDSAALARLAQLDGRGDTLAGDAVVAVVGGDVVAARDLRGGVVSDPFRAAEDVVALLDVRARQLAGGRFGRRARVRARRQAMPVLRVGGAR